MQRAAHLGQLNHVQQYYTAVAITSVKQIAYSYRDAAAGVEPTGIFRINVGSIRLYTAVAYSSTVGRSVRFALNTTTVCAMCAFLRGLCCRAVVAQDAEEAVGEEERATLQTVNQRLLAEIEEQVRGSLTRHFPAGVLLVGRGEVPKPVTAAALRHDHRNILVSSCAWSR